MSIIGRNDPCPCGSGKKYKRCCLPFYEDSIDVDKKKINALLLLGDYSFSTYNESFKDVLSKFEMKRLSSIETFEDLLSEDESIYPLEWFMFNEYVSKGKTPLELFLEEKDTPLEMKDFLKNWISTYWSFYRVEGIFPQINRLDLFDPFLDRTYRVFDPGIKDPDITNGDIIFTRLIPYKGFHITGFVFFPYWIKDIEEIKRFVEEKVLSLRRGETSTEDLLRVYGYRLFKETKDILEETMEIGAKSPTEYRAIYKLKDYDRVISLLSLSPMFFRINSFPNGETFNCMSSPIKRGLLNALRKDEEDIGYIGSVMVMKAPDNLLVGMSDNREDLEDLKDILEELLGDLIVYHKQTSVSNSE
jgi:hypothetical protein